MTTRRSGGRGDIGRAIAQMLLRDPNLKGADILRRIKNDFPRGIRKQTALDYLRVLKQAKSAAQSRGGGEIAGADELINAVLTGRGFGNIPDLGIVGHDLSVPRKIETLRLAGAEIVTGYDTQKMRYGDIPVKGMRRKVAENNQLTLNADFSGVFNVIEFGTSRTIPFSGSIEYMGSVENFDAGAFDRAVENKVRGEIQRRQAAIERDSIAGRYNDKLQIETRNVRTTKQSRLVLR